MALIHPEVMKHSSYREYFSEFFQMNKKRSTAFSHRGFAKNINWPLAYLSDIIHGHKKLTLQRALEFSNFSKLNPVEVDRLLLLVLKESPISSVRNYALSKLASGTMISQVEMTTPVQESSSEIAI